MQITIIHIAKQSCDTPAKPNWRTLQTKPYTLCEKPYQCLDNDGNFIREHITCRIQNIIRHPLMPKVEFLCINCKNDIDFPLLLLEVI